VKAGDAKPRAFAPSAWQPVPENEVFLLVKTINQKKL